MISWDRIAFRYYLRQRTRTYCSIFGIVSMFDNTYVPHEREIRKFQPDDLLPRSCSFIQTGEDLVEVDGSIFEGERQFRNQNGPFVEFFHDHFAAFSFEGCSQVSRYQARVEIVSSRTIGNIHRK